jgi:hypothetical protein
VIGDVKRARPRLQRLVHFVFAIDAGRFEPRACERQQHGLIAALLRQRRERSLR